MTDNSAQSLRHVFKSKWTKILKSEDGTAYRTLDTNVSDFLNNGTQPPVAGVPAPPPMSARPDKSPRIDVSVAQRWPDAAQIRRPSQDRLTPTALPVKTTGRVGKHKGLVVRFSPGPPEVIGFGGDETGLAPIEISRNRTRAYSLGAERNPVDPSVAHVLPQADPSQHRAGVKDMTESAKTAQNSAAFSRLAAAGIFAERAPSRERRQRADSGGEMHPGYDLRVHPSHCAPEHITTPTPEHEGSTSLAASITPPGRPLPLPQVQFPNKEHDASEVFVAHGTQPGQGENLNRTRQRMRQEEGRTFSQAFRLNQKILEPGSPRRPLSPDDGLASISHRPVPSSYGSSEGLTSLGDGLALSQGAIAQRSRSPMLNSAEMATVTANHSGRSHVEHSDHPTDHLGQDKGISRLPPQAYIEVFRARSSSKSVHRQQQQHQTHLQPHLQAQPHQQTHSQPQLQAQPQQQQQHGNPYDFPQQPQGSSNHSPEQTTTGLGVYQTTIDQPIRTLPPQSSSSMAHNQRRDHQARRPLPPTSHVSQQSVIGLHNNAFMSETDEHPKLSVDSSRSIERPISELSRNGSDSSVRHANSKDAACFDDFAARVKQMKGVFRLTAEKERPNETIQTRAWLRCAYWWSHRSKLDLDLQAHHSQNRGLLTQAHVNVAKSWWILTEVIERRSITDNHDDAIDTDDLRSQLRSSCHFMSRKNLMPPHAALIQGQDTTIWIRYPPFPSDVQNLLGSTARTDVPGVVLPSGDKQDYFFYRRLFVSGSTSTGDARSDRARLPCILSVVRHRSHYRASIFVASQNGLVNILVGQPIGQGSKGPTWYDIAWKAKSFSFSIKLAHGLILDLNLEESDYRYLANMLEFTRSIDKSSVPSPSEKLIYSTQLHEATYTDSTRSHSFPDGRVRKAFLGMFQDVRIEQTQKKTQRSHHGYRLLLIAPTVSRTLGLVNQVYDASLPFDLEFPAPARDMPGPAVILHSPIATKPWRARLDFDSKHAFSEWLDVLQGTFKAVDEYVKLKLSLTGFTAQPMFGGTLSPSTSSLTVLERLQWRDANVLTRRSEQPVTVLSDSLRIILNHKAGSIIDRLNFLPGELLFRLSVSGGEGATTSNTLEIARRPQTDVHSVVSRIEALPAMLDKLLDVGRALSSTPTLRQLSFATRSDLHAFEEELTGYRVSFDGVASLFSITRRSDKVVSAAVHKKVETGHVRLQVLNKLHGGSSGYDDSSGGGSGQLVAAFFQDFAAATAGEDAMLLEISGSSGHHDIERFRGGKDNARFGVRLLEARYRVPRLGGGERDGSGNVDDGGGAVDLPRSVRSRFVNLDGLDYLEELQDVVVGFEDESDADALCDALLGRSGGTGSNGSVHVAAGRNNFPTRMRN